MDVLRVSDFDDIFIIFMKMHRLRSFINIVGMLFVRGVDFQTVQCQKINLREKGNTIKNSKKVFENMGGGGRGT